MCYNGQKFRMDFFANFKRHSVFLGGGCLFVCLFFVVFFFLFFFVVVFLLLLLFFFLFFFLFSMTRVHCVIHLYMSRSCYLDLRVISCSFAFAGGTRRYIYSVTVVFFYVSDFISLLPALSTSWFAEW